MSHQVHKFKPGQCICILGDPFAGPQKVNVRKISATEAVLDPAEGLHEDQFVYATVELEGGPSMALSGIVASAAAGGLLVQWKHSSFKEADKLDTVLRTYREEAAAPTEPAEASKEGTKEPATSKDASPQPKNEKKEKAEGKNADPLLPSAKKSKRSDFEAGVKGKKQGETGRTGKESTRKRPGAGGKSTAPDRKTGAAASEPRHRIKPLREVVIGKQTLSVSANILRRAKTVRSSEIASRLDTVHVLNMSSIKNLMNEAIDEAVAMLGSPVGAAERKRLLEEAEEGFKERIESFQAEKAGLEAHAKHLEEQLERAQTVLEEERQRVVSASQFTVSDAGMVELEQKLGRILDRALKSGNVTPELESDMRAVVARLLDDERDKIREQEEQAQNQKIQLLEKKIQRLASTLDQTAKDRDKAQRRAQALEASGGGLPLKNIMHAGLDDDDPERERKLDLLKQIVQFNRDIRKELQSAGRLPTEGRKKAPKVDKEGTGGSSVESDKSSSGEKEIAESLGIQRAHPEPDENEEAHIVETSATPGEDVDPDDMQWEPDAKRPGGSKPANFKRLGG